MGMRSIIDDDKLTARYTICTHTRESLDRKWETVIEILMRYQTTRQL